jgi:hypothetical protein
MRKLRAVHRSRVEVTRHDLAPMIRALCQNIVDKSEANTRRLDEQDRLWKYDQAEVLWYRARPLDLDGVPLRPGSPRWRADVISGLPAPVLVLNAFGATEQSLEVELRFKYAHEVMAQRLVRDWDDARARASKAKILCAEVVR